MDTKQKRTQGVASGKKTTRKAPAKSATGERRTARPATAVKTRKSAAKTTKTAAEPKRTAASQRKSAPRRKPAKQPKPAAQPRPSVDVVYTPAKPFNRNRLLLQLTTVVAVVLALTFGVSIFFKVDTVAVTGNQKYSAWTVMEASGIQKGDNLLTFGKAKASGRITAALPYVESVRIGIKLPDTVNIEIKELDVAYGIQDGSENWWLMTAEGRVVEKLEAGIASEYTQVVGVNLQTPVPGQSAIAQEPQQTTPTDESTAETVVTVPVTVTAADRLTAALSILQYLEAEELFDNIASVDVTSLGNIQLWYGQQYHVMLGDTSQLSYKISQLNGAINGENALKDYDSGILDITFTTSQGEVVIYEPFD